MARAISMAQIVLAGHARATNLHLRQGKCDQRIAKLRAQFAVTTRGDHHELLAVMPQAIRHRRRLAARWQAAFPEFRASVDVERPQIVVHC